MKQKEMEDLCTIYCIIIYYEHCDYTGEHLKAMRNKYFYQILNVLLLIHFGLCLLIVAKCLCTYMRVLCMAVIHITHHTSTTGRKNTAFWRR